MKVLRCVVADDEPIARQIIEGYCQELPQIEIVASCKNAFEVMEVLQQQAIDLLFLDINMPKLTGLGLLKSLRHRPSVIITTAYPEYAVEGFALEVTDYLLKPFSLERFVQAVLKVHKVQENQIPIQERNTTIESPQILFVKSDKKIIRLHVDEIRHVEAYGNYIKIYHREMTLSAQTLTDFMTNLPSQFLRIHRSSVANLHHLKLIDGNRLFLRDGTQLTIGKSYRKTVYAYIEKYS